MKFFFRWLVLLVVTFTFAGCVSTSTGDGGGKGTFRLTLMPSGNLELNDTEFPRAQIVKALQRNGVKPDSTIIVNIQDKTQMSEVSALTQTLATAGYRHVFFKRPQQAKSTVVKP